MAMSAARDGIRRLGWLRRLEHVLKVALGWFGRAGIPRGGILEYPIPEYGSGDSSDLTKIPTSTIENWLPERPVASRCKDFVEFREVLALDTTERLFLKRFMEGDSRPVRWLDLCCGKGSILRHMESTLKDKCKKLQYVGVDIHKGFIDECEKAAEGLNLTKACDSMEFRVHDLAKLELPTKLRQFDIVTMLNVLHEIPPHNLFDFIWTAIDRCKPGGTLIFIDMEILPHLEWEAIPWKASEFMELLRVLVHDDLRSSLENATLTNSYPRSVPVGRVELKKKLIDLSLCGTAASREATRAKFQRKVTRMLRKMLKDTEEIISTIEQVGGSANGQVHSDLAKSIYDSNLQFLPQYLWKHYAVSSALKRM